MNKKTEHEEDNDNDNGYYDNNVGLLQAVHQHEDGTVGSSKEPPGGSILAKHRRSLPALSGAIAAATVSPNNKNRQMVVSSVQKRVFEFHLKHGRSGVNVLDWCLIGGRRGTRLTHYKAAFFLSSNDPNYLTRLSAGFTLLISIPTPTTLIPFPFTLPISTPSSILPSRLDAILGRTTVDKLQLASLTAEEIKSLRPHVSDRFLIELEPGHLRRFMSVVPLNKNRLNVINKARLLIKGGAVLDMDTLAEATRFGMCGSPHRTHSGKTAHTCISFFDEVRMLSLIIQNTI